MDRRFIANDGQLTTDDRRWTADDGGRTTREIQLNPSSVLCRLSSSSGSLPPDAWIPMEWDLIDEFIGVRLGEIDVGLGDFRHRLAEHGEHGFRALGVHAAGGGIHRDRVPER